MKKKHVSVYWMNVFYEQFVNHHTRRDGQLVKWNVNESQLITILSQFTILEFCFEGLESSKTNR